MDAAAIIAVAIERAAFGEPDADGYPTASTMKDVEAILGQFAEAGNQVEDQAEEPKILRLYSEQSEPRLAAGGETVTYRRAADVEAGRCSTSKEKKATKPASPIPAATAAPAAPAAPLASQELAEVGRILDVIKAKKLLDVQTALEAKAVKDAAAKAEVERRRVEAERQRREAQRKAMEAEREAERQAEAASLAEAERQYAEYSRQHEAAEAARQAEEVRTRAARRERQSLLADLQDVVREAVAAAVTDALPSPVTGQRLERDAEGRMTRVIRQHANGTESIQRIKRDAAGEIAETVQLR